MPQQSSSPFNSSPDPGFIPRKEFIREQKVIPSSFAIVAISASSLIRLYSFSSSVVIALRVLLETSSSLVAFREDVQQHFCEFVLAGKPWASPKSVRAEKLLIDILAAIYQCGYTYLSSLGYGGESDDRLAMAFAKPLISPSASSRSATPLPATRSISPFRDSSVSSTSDKPKSRPTPFALSFLSPTLMRVIAPPLHLTPAILQAVRASWPRGVVSERKIGDNSFEFKLKGYKWFQQDTYATDSLRHILALLTSLDSQAFTLLSSLSMTNRSRVKDLWVFIGPGPDNTEDLVHQESTVSPSVRNEFNGDINRNTGQLGSSLAGISHHQRLVSEPTGFSTCAPHHIRAPAEQGNAQKFSLVYGYRAETSMGPTLLRKPAPRAQVPVSIVHEGDPPGIDGVRVHLPSSISSGVEDMTGVGANGFFPEASQTSEHSERSPATVSSSRRLLTTPATRPQSPLRPSVNHHEIPQSLASNLASSTHHLPYAGRQDLSNESLVSGACRDSVKSEGDLNISIQRTGVGDTIDPQKEGNSAQQTRGIMTPSRRKVSTVGPILPGGWQPSPIEEKSEGLDGITEFQIQLQPEDSGPRNTNAGKNTPIHEVASRVASPELTRPEMPLRKSEAALVGLITDTSPVPASPMTSRDVGADSPTSGKGQGWVLVSVGESSTGSQVRFGEPVDGTQALGGTEHATPSSHAKAIAVIDVLDNKSKGKGRSDALVPVKKRFFGFGRKNSEKARTNVPPQANADAGSPKPRFGSRDISRITNTSEGATKEKEH
ncbi:hypothetical protein J132_03232 [Termitomyces sp. J132]|nr:hypothetical protein H2248_000675 [Termitomyces sp. 'cryptogamus']KNZ73468.1 hypothetical protein J132_03232 [Termitomyces sp. J132]